VLSITTGVTGAEPPPLFEPLRVKSSSFLKPWLGPDGLALVPTLILGVELCPAFDEFELLEDGLIEVTLEDCDEENDLPPLLS
jgi:hypothetical protein